MDTIFTLEKLYTAYRACLKGKRNTANALKFEYDREKNLCALLTELQTRTYRVSRHMYFIVTHPTPREIFAADFRDRVVHHLLCNEIQGLFEQGFSPHSYANRKGKGTHRAVKQVQRDMHCVRRHYPKGKWYLKLDIENFFRSIDRTVLYDLIEEKIKIEANVIQGVLTPRCQQELLWLVWTIVFHDPTTDYVYRGHPRKRALIPPHKSLLHGSSGAGLPIGNLTSQFFANIYLDALDRFVTKKLGINCYARYVDDFVLMDTDRRRLTACRRPIEVFLRETLKLQLHSGKTQLQQCVKGLDLLGYIVRPNYILVRRKVVGRMRVVLMAFDTNYACCYGLSIETLIEGHKALADSIASYLGHFSHATTYRLCRQTQAFIDSLSYEKHSGLG
jgi:RNA-directed DNA polymerase